MKVAIFSTKPYDRRFLEAANREAGHDLRFFEPRLVPETTPLAAGFPAICAFVNDRLDLPVLEALADGGARLIALRSAGFNNVDLAAADALGMTIARVPAYSPYAVAEHTVGLMLALNRKLPRAAARVREGNFALDGLLGFDMRGKTAGIVGTGKIGTVVARILAGFGCRLLAYDPYPNDEATGLGVTYVSLADLLAVSDIVTLHLPLTPESRHMIDAGAIVHMKPGAMLVNTSRGALLDTTAVIEGLKSGRIGSLGLDVYEEEADLFFEDLSSQVIQDDIFARLLTFPNVLITGHQAFFTAEALTAIAETTLGNITAIERGEPCSNVITGEMVAPESARKDARLADDVPGNPAPGPPEPFPE
ncbi:MAG TPA: 2-hydroxyacid dehydrogenase [Thermomicrobiales bacterium]|nr:2-hydroxyacid dehydrogenase [Thermomicrobiales bacterium]